MHPDKKATGWKIPLLFCAVLILAIMAGSFFRKKAPVPPSLPARLMELASATHIDIDRDEDRIWKDQISEAAANFLPAESKDLKLGEIVRAALSQERPDVAGAALIHIKGIDAREKALNEIHLKALEDCAKLHWSVFSIHSSREQAHMDDMARELLDKWEICQKR